MVRQWCQRPGDNNDIPYFETSAKEATHVEQAFKTVARIAKSVIMRHSTYSYQFNDGFKLMNDPLKSIDDKKNCKCQ